MKARWQTLIPSGFRRYIRWTYAKLRQPGVIIHAGVDIGMDSKVEAPARLYEGSRIFSSSVGKYSCVGIDSILINARIGRFCSIAPRVIIGGGVHPSREWVSSSPCFYSTWNQVGAKFSDTQKFDELPETVIGHDVWLGYNALVLPGVAVGNGAIVGAGAVVTKNVEPYAVVVGNPAKVTRLRFERAEIEWLMNVQWWDWDNSKLSILAGNFASLKELSIAVDREAGC